MDGGCRRSSAQIAALFKCRQPGSVAAGSRQLRIPHSHDGDVVGLALGLGDFGGRLGGAAADGGDVLEAEEFAVRVTRSHYTLGNSVKCSLKVMESA